MKRLIWFVAASVLVPLSAAAQGVPPVPPAPPAVSVPPAPSAPQLPPSRRARPVLVVPVEPFVVPPIPVVPPMPPIEIDHFALEDLRDRIQHLKDDIQVNFENQPNLLNEVRLQALAQSDAVKAQVDVIKAQAAAAAKEVTKDFKYDFKYDFPEFRVESGEWFKAAPFELQGPPRVVVARAGEDVGLYNGGLNAVTQRQYDRAIVLFDRLLSQSGNPRADGAMYWKAFSQWKLSRTEDALATLTSLRRDYPQSRYLGDAKVLEADVKKMAGQKIDPQTIDANDEMKLLAINGIANTDPDRAIPLLEGVLNATNTLNIKKRALYVLALSNDPRAHQILLRYAKGGGNPELQAEAVRYLATRRDRPATDTELKEIYESTQDANVRRSIIDAYRNNGNKTALVAIAKDKTEKADLKRTAIDGLSNLATPAELWSLYQVEQDAEIKNQMISVFGSMGALDQLTQIAKTEKDAAVRAQAFRRLGSQRNDRTSQLLVDLYAGEQDKELKKSIISALQSQNNAEGLVAIARKETDLDLKREIVRRLSDMAPKNKVAADYLMEIIK